MLEKFYITCAQENHWTLDADRADDKIIFLRDEYEKFWKKILRGENFALTRQADDELALMLNAFRSADAWKISGEKALGAALKETLNIDAENFYYGISCPCCDSAAYYWYLQNIKSPNVTFSNLWVNANFKSFYENFQALKRDAVLITNWRGKDKTYGRLNVLRHYVVSDDCVKFWKEDGENLIRQIIAEVGREKNLLYVVSAGPLSCVIIAALFKNNPDNCYVDFGSAIDFVTHDKINRRYATTSNPTVDKNCWMFDRKKISVDVDVVLTCYKRPQILSQQLAAIKNQTLAPRRIFLYQDGIDGYYKVELNDKILNEFDAYKIAKTNGGVWKRFEFAEEICKSPYVCLFDDDTIPGERWLENCHMNSLQNRGVYGTNGVLMTEPEEYPRKFLNVGWHKPNIKTCAVDFVGHSWFFEREFLNGLLSKSWSKNYKRCGEDMTLSVAAAERGFGTYVPQHPVKILSLWGSLPEFGWSYGDDEIAIHKNPDNVRTMINVLKEIRASGWQCLLEQNPDYLSEFSSIVGQISRPDESKELLQALKIGAKNLLPFFGQKTPIFLGEKKYSPIVQKIFNLRPENYHVLENENDEIETARLFDTLRRGAVHIFFIDVYSELKPFLEQWNLAENVDFIDGRGVLVAVMD